MEPNLQEIYKVYRAHPQHKSYVNICCIQNSWHIFEVNYQDLISIIDAWNYEVKASVGKDISSAELTEGKLASFRIKFHNFINSLYTLENHLLTTGKENEDFSFIKSDFERNLQDNPDRLLLFALRNYFTHEASPPIAVSINQKRLSDGSFETSGLFILYKNDIDYRAYSKWLRSREKFNIMYTHIIRTYGRRIDMKDIIINGYTFVANWYSLEKEKMINVSRAEFEEVGTLHIQIKNLQKDMKSRL